MLENKGKCLRILLAFVLNFPASLPPSLTITRKDNGYKLGGVRTRKEVFSICLFALVTDKAALKFPNVL